MADKDVIKEFLVKLGFTKDEKGLRDFSKGVDAATAKVTKLATTVLATATAVTAGVTAFAKGMEGMYFASKQSGASISSLKAFENAVQNITGAGAEAVSTVQALASWMRYQPGSEGILKSFGVDARDANGNLKDTAQILTELGVSMRNMSPYYSKAVADKLNIPEGVYRAMMDGSFDAQLAKQKQILKDSGYQDAANSSHEFMASLRELRTEIEISFLPVLKELVSQMGPSLKNASQWFIDNKSNIAGVFNAIAGALKVMNGMIDKSIDGWKNLIKWVEYFGEKAYKKLPKNMQQKLGEWTYKSLVAIGAVDELPKPNLNQGAGNGGSVGKYPSGDKQTYLRSIEQKYGLPSGFLDRVWKTESNRGQNMKSGKGALGHFQFMPNTAKFYGLDDPFDFYKSADASGRMYRDLAKQYHGDLRKAAAAYNWGSGNLNSYGLGRAPRETREYIDKVAPQISQETNIYIQGGDAAATGRAVAGEQNRVNADIARNFATAMR